MVFKNENELKGFILAKCQMAVAEAEQKVYEVIDTCLEKFYGEFTPAEYIRTSQLLHSLVKTDVVRIGDSITAEVYFDVGALAYEQGFIPVQHTPEHGMYGLATWTGQKVLDVAMTDGLPHGRYASGTAIWTDSMSKLGNILKILEQALIAQGIPIKKG